MSPSRAWQVATVAFLVLFAFAAVESLQLSLRDALGPGPGFFPFWLGVAGGLLAIQLLVQTRRGRLALPAGPLTLAADARRRVLAVVVTRQAVASVCMALMAAGCASSVPRQGASESVSWEVRRETLVLRETAGIGIDFASVKYALPLPPTGAGKEYFGGMGERTFLRRLEPYAELRGRLSVAHPTGIAEYEFRGVDDRGRPVTIKVSVESQQRKP
jgi:hypothetical protein